MLEWIRFGVGAFFIVCGLLLFIIEVFGSYHFDFVLNRMHTAAIGDTLGIAFSMVGLMIFSGLNFTTLKMGMVVLFLWLSSPVSSHLIARLEITTDEKIDEYCEVEKDDNI